MFQQGKGQNRTLKKLPVNRIRWQCLTRASRLGKHRAIAAHSKFSSIHQAQLNDDIGANSGVLDVSPAGESISRIFTSTRRTSRNFGINTQDCVQARDAHTDTFAQTNAVPAEMETRYLENNSASQSSSVKLVHDDTDRWRRPYFSGQHHPRKGN